MSVPFTAEGELPVWILLAWDIGSDAYLSGVLWRRYTHSVAATVPGTMATLTVFRDCSKVHSRDRTYGRPPGWHAISTLRHGTGALVTEAVETCQVEHFARKTDDSSGRTDKHADGTIWAYTSRLIRTRDSGAPQEFSPPWFTVVYCAVYSLVEYMLRSVAVYRSFALLCGDIIWCTYFSIQSEELLNELGVHFVHLRRDANQNVEVSFPQLF